MTVADLTQPDVSIVRAQLGREPRDLVGVAHRCPCGNPDVVSTSPRLSDGSPFPTFYYLTCPRAAAAIGSLEAAGLMARLAAQLDEDADLRARYRRAHVAYLAERSVYGDVAEVSGISAGGMPDRVKCLHALVAHSLAAGPGANPIGDDALGRLPRWWAEGPCVGVE